MAVVVVAWTALLTESVAVQQQLMGRSTTRTRTKPSKRRKRKKMMNKRRKRKKMRNKIKVENPELPCARAVWGWMTHARPTTSLKLVVQAHECVDRKGLVCRTVEMQMGVVVLFGVGPAWVGAQRQTRVDSIWVELLTK